MHESATAKPVIELYFDGGKMRKMTHFRIVNT